MRGLDAQAGGREVRHQRARLNWGHGSLGILFPERARAALDKQEVTLLVLYLISMAVSELDRP